MPTSWAPPSSEEQLLGAPAHVHRAGEQVACVAPRLGDLLVHLRGLLEGLARLVEGAHAREQRRLDEARVEVLQGAPALLPLGHRLAHPRRLGGPVGLELRVDGVATLDDRPHAERRGDHAAGDGGHRHHPGQGEAHPLLGLPRLAGLIALVLLGEALVLAALLVVEALLLGEKAPASGYPFPSAP